ncbi:hypothetical protein HYS47_05035 [Candidatus Woesearchaeota archaeon]|nr:hypothetical protein [Candidatus Woesearchaeota archaeon]
MAEQTTLDKHLNAVLGIKDKSLSVQPSSSSTKAPEQGVQSPSVSAQSLSSLVGRSSSTAEKPTEEASLDQLGLGVKQYDKGESGRAHQGGQSSSYATIALEKMKRGEGVVSDAYATTGSSDPSTMYSIAGDIDDLMSNYSSSTNSSVGDRYHDSMSNVGVRYDADPCCDRDNMYLG